MAMCNHIISGCVFKTCGARRCCSAATMTVLASAANHTCKCATISCKSCDCQSCGLQMGDAKTERNRTNVLCARVASYLAVLQPGRRVLRRPIETLIGVGNCHGTA